MKRFVVAGVVSLLLVMMSGCGGGSVKFDSGMSEQDREAVLKTKSSLSSGDKMESFSVVTSKLPLALLEPEYKSVRDEVNKAKLDYINCLKRGLDGPAQQKLEILKQVQTTIQEKDSSINVGSGEYIFVLADVKERTRRDGNLTGFIAVYDPETLEQVDFMQVTTPLYNNAVMMTEALEGRLADPKYFTENPSELTSNNPVVSFILRSNPK